MPVEPVDSDGDGQAEAEILNLRARQFEAIAFDGQRLFVSAVNMLRAEAPALYAPGMVLVFDWDGEHLQPANAPVLWPGFVNPQALLLDDSRLYVVSTGVIEQGDNGWQAKGPAGLSVFARDDLRRLAQLDLGRSAPGPIVRSDDGKYLYIGSLLRAELYKIDLGQLRILRGPEDPIRLVGASGPQSVFGLRWHPAGLILASSFNQDALFVVDSADDQVSPWPFVQPLALNPDSQVLAGSQQIALRPGRNGVDFRGADLYILQSLAARVVAVDTRYVLGP